MSDFGPLLFGILFCYIIIFFLIAAAIDRRYFKVNLMDLLKLDTLLEIYRNDENKSHILAGSALIALTFIITVNNNNLANIDSLIGFFGLAFIFEIVSSFLFHDLKKAIYGFLGTVFQYGGIMSILLGFHAYFLEKEMPFSYIPLIFAGGIIAIVLLTVKELVEYRQNVHKLFKK